MPIKEIRKYGFLTENEKEIAKLNHKGKDADEIAEEVGVSVQWVYKAVKRIREKKSKARKTLEFLEGLEGDPR